MDRLHVLCHQTLLAHGTPAVYTWPTLPVLIYLILFDMSQFLATLTRIILKWS